MFNRHRTALATAALAGLALATVGAALPASAQPAPVRLSLNKTATASSELNATMAAHWVNDGKLSTSWWSKPTPTKQWIKIDLGKKYDIDRVELRWAYDYAKSERIQVSTNNATWTEIYQNTDVTKRNQSIPAGMQARYVRVVGDKPSSNHGYSINEFAVYGTEIAAAQ